MPQVLNGLETRQNGLRLLYLGFAFPPGVAALHPGRNPAGHALETRMVAELRRSFEVRSAGLLPVVAPRLEDAEPASGIAHELLLVEKRPELFYRWRALAHLKALYRRWRAAGWIPDLVLVYNMTPVYNHFLLWLRRQPSTPKLVLLLSDSATLGQPVPWRKRFRHRFKPLFIPDSEMIRRFDACVGLSPTTAKHFRPRQVPFLWLPGGCTPERVLRQNGTTELGVERAPVRFGYFGALAAHSGVKPLVETFLALDLPGAMALCGYGKFSGELAQLARDNRRLDFQGLLSPAEALRFGRGCDVLVNPRPLSHGNENNFASKLFDYALCGRAILTARLSGAEAVLGPEALYFEPEDFRNSLAKKLLEAAALPRTELNRRGLAIQERVFEEFSWSEQGARLARFLEGVCGYTAAPGLAQALAA